MTDRMANTLTHHRVLYPGRAQFVIVNLSPQLQLGIINVYGFNHTGPRAMLWHHIAQADLPEVEWILASDFNNIEQLQDKQGGLAKTSISLRELEAWNRLLVRLGVRDAHNLGSFTRQSAKTFTWTNAHNNESMIQSRIDRIYVPIRLEQVGGTTHILPTLPDVSDHAGVVLHFSDKGKQKKRTPFPIKACYQTYIARTPS